MRRAIFKANIFIPLFSFILSTNYTFADVKTDIYPVRNKALLLAQGKKQITREELNSQSDISNGVYSKLKCCLCKNPFINCVCPEAKEMKAYIEAFLDAGLNEEGILIKVAKKYSLSVIIDEETRKEIERKLIEEAGDKRPEIFIQSLSYNLGKVSKSKDKLESVVDIYNKGNAVLTIYDLKTSCGCTKVKLKTKKSISPAFSIKGAESGWKADIAPGEKAELIVVTHLAHPSTKLGPMLRVVKIKSNDLLYPLIEVRLEAEIVE